MLHSLAAAIELQEGLGDGLKALAVQRGGTAQSQGGKMLGRAVALVAGEPVAGELAVEFHQQAVAVNLGQNAGGGDGEAAARRPG